MNDLAKKLQERSQMAPTAPKPRELRRPTGKPSWPVLLIAGREKSGKSYQAALASTSDLIDRTFWVGWGEKDPDEYGAIPGARFEIAAHDNTLNDFRDTLRHLLTLDAGSGEKPHLWVVDSVSKLWATLKDKATYLATQRGNKDRSGEVIITTDLWNRVNQEWSDILNLIRLHQGPVILTARLDTVTVMEAGKPTKEKTEKIQGQKNLAYDVDAIVEMPARGEAQLVGARSVIYQIPSRVDLGADFTVDGLWRRLGLDKVEVAQPTYAEAVIDPNGGEE